MGFASPTAAEAVAVAAVGSQAAVAVGTSAASTSSAIAGTSAIAVDPSIAFAFAVVAGTSSAAGSCQPFGHQHLASVLAVCAQHSSA